MKKSIIFLFTIGLFPLKGSAQNLKAITAQFFQQSIKSNMYSGKIHDTACDPDSILGYGYMSPSDSVLGQRQIFKKYGNTATSLYTYAFTDAPLQLYSIDSTRFNVAGQAIFRELLEYNEDANVLEISKRFYYYPHEGAAQMNYFFPEYIVNFLESNQKDNIALDSVILYRKSFFTGMMEPNEKTVNLYTSAGKLQEKQIFSWDEFGTKSWYPKSKMMYFYTASGLNDHWEEYNWNGIEYKLQLSTQFMYDSNDSLSIALGTNAQTGLPSEKLEMTYDTPSKSSTAQFYAWDTNVQQWVLSLKIAGEFNAENRIEKVETLSSFLGSTDGFRYEYIFINEDDACPLNTNIYTLENSGNWEFVGKFYYYPNLFTAAQQWEVPKWTVYPNPSHGGIWVKAPSGTRLEITTPDGVVLFKGTTDGENQYIELLNPPHQAVISLFDRGRISSQMISFIK